MMEEKELVDVKSLLIKMKCKRCYRNYKRVTQQELCASCYKIENGMWAKEFSEPKKGKGRRKSK